MKLLPRDVHYDASSYEQVAAVDLALLNLDELAERFGLGQGRHLFRQYLRWQSLHFVYDAVHPMTLSIPLPKEL